MASQYQNILFTVITLRLGYRLLNYLVLIVEYPVAYEISILLSVEDITRISGIYSFTYSAVSKIYTEPH